MSSLRTWMARQPRNTSAPLPWSGSASVSAVPSRRRPRCAALPSWRAAQACSWSAGPPFPPPVPCAARSPCRGSAVPLPAASAPRVPSARRAPFWSRPCPLRLPPPYARRWSRVCAPWSLPRPGSVPAWKSISRVLKSRSFYINLT